MGEAKRRGTFEERKAQAIRAGGKLPRAKTRPRSTGNLPFDLFGSPLLSRAARRRLKIY